MIIEYMLHRVPGGLTVPGWIQDGGHFHDPDNRTFVGWSPNFDQREYYVPDSVVVLTRETMLARQLDLNARYPFLTMNGQPMSDQQIADMVNDWCAERGE